jgi:hypothetical protein
VIGVVELINLEDQVDLDFTLARRRARLGKLKARLFGRATRSTLLSPRISVGACQPVEPRTGAGGQSRYRR